MNKKYKFLLLALVMLGVAGAAGGLAWFIGNHNVAVLNPVGTIADKQRNLILIAVALMLIIVLPVFALTFGIAWRYRASNAKATYSPELDGNRTAETIWWLIPFAIISILAVIAWQSSHDLDPYKKLEASTPPIKIQVVALNWKWLFLYPDQGIATVNFVQFPQNTPVDFQITSDAPMNSFWIPQLGGQVYAMTGMSTQLHLMADRVGDFRGSSANISGEGFADMKFRARVSTKNDFDNWVRSVEQSPTHLTQEAYGQLAKPSTNNLPTFYASHDLALYDSVVMKYMMPMGQN